MGIFEFELTNRPSILIFSTDGCAQGQCSRHFGMFLSGLLGHCGVPEIDTLHADRIEIAERLSAAA